VTRDPHKLSQMLAAVPVPAALCDLEALERNVDKLVQGLGDRPVTLRVATKSVRHVGLLWRILARGADRICGLMAYAASELPLLIEAGFDDLLLAYPIGRRHEALLVADAVARGATTRCVVDDAAQVQLLAEAASERQVEIPLVLDVDVSWRVGPLHLGVRRSPIRSAQAAVELAALIAVTPGVTLGGIMAYEAQIAGMRDTDLARRFIKARSRPLTVGRRAEVVAALRAAGHPVPLVNGGGTGSVSFTAADASVTEVTAGSGFLCSHLFDGYGLEPAAWFALAVVRRSDEGFVTCAGGGYVASGAAGADRLPVVDHPQGLVPLSLEGWGEVQTPFRWKGEGAAPALGQIVLGRHAKAGELAERFATYHLVRGDTIVASEPTYRGMGACIP
jgi:D-serine deaminase-like pyridoxal phosphate-dependent protein